MVLEKVGLAYIHNMHLALRATYYCRLGTCVYVPVLCTWYAVCENPCAHFGPQKRDLLGIFATVSSVLKS